MDTGRVEMHITRSTAQQHLTSPHRRWSRISFDPNHYDTFVFLCLQIYEGAHLRRSAKHLWKKGTSLMQFRWLHVERRIDVSVLSTPDFRELDVYFLVISEDMK